MCDGLGSSLAALFGVLPNTSFSQNVGPSIAFDADATDEDVLACE